MFVDYKNEVLAFYSKKKKDGTLSINLQNPTPGSLKRECIIVCNEHQGENDRETLRAFFGTSGNNEGFSSIIKHIDIDRFRPLQGFISKRVPNPDPKNIELLAWLLNFTPRPFGVWKDRVVKMPSPILPPTVDGNTGYKKLILTITIGVIIICCSSFAYWKIKFDQSIDIPANEQKCMYWNGNHYIPIACNSKIEGSNTIPLNIERAYRLKKINFPDTLTKNSIGKVWYSKINNKHEFFTASGMHPKDTTKKLKPLTNYIIAHHTSYYRFLFHSLLIILGLATLITVSVLWILKKYRHKKIALIKLKGYPL